MDPQVLKTLPVFPSPRTVARINFKGQILSSLTVPILPTMQVVVPPTTVQSSFLRRHKPILLPQDRVLVNIQGYTVQYKLSPYIV